jgi:AcrR family transcriptional regulator
MPSQDQGDTLRMRKRAVVRAALGDAARRLVLKQGLDQVLVQDIAAEAGVSARTFNNYFSSKEEAVFASAFDRTARIVLALRQRPASEPLWQSLTEAFLQQFPAEGHIVAEMALQARMVADSPGLLAEQLKMYAAIERMLARELAERLGVDLREDLLPRLAASIAVAAARVAFEYWLDLQADRPFRPLLAQALHEAGAGLSATTAGTS